MEKENEAAQVVVEELLSTVFEEATSRSQWDVTDRGKRLAESVACVENSKRRDGPVTDLCSLVRKHCADRIVVNYSLRGCGHTELLQLKCVDQKASGYCGHYALHNLVCALEVCQSCSEEDALGLLQETASPGAFWRRYWWSVSQLLVRVNAEGGEWWPWTRDYVQQGDMERSFLRHLITVDTQLTTLDADNTVAVVMFAYGFIQNSFSEVCDIQKKIDDFVSSSGPAHLVFILGVTNHWVSLLAYKTSSSNRLNGYHHHQQRVGIIYMDSNNVPVPGCTDEDIDAHLLKQENERIKVKGKGYTEWKRETYRQAYKDQRELVLKLTRCVSGCGNLCTDVIIDYISRVMKSYDECVKQRLVELEDSSLFLPLLLDWLQNHYPPQTLNQTLLPMLEQNAGLTELDPLREWAGHVHAQLSLLEISGLTAIDLLLEILETILTKL